MKDYKSEKGIISLVVLLAMIFLLVFVFGMYSMTLNRKQNEELKSLELEKIYTSNFNEVENYTYAPDDEIVPIYDIRELDSMGTGEYIQVKDKVYKCSRGKSYELKQNIIVDIKEDLDSPYIGFNDYKLYLPTYYIDKSYYDLYYYYNNEYWKTIAYQKFELREKDLVKSGTYEESKFSIVNEYKFDEEDNFKFMMVWSNKDGELNKIAIENQDFKPNSLNQINVFNKHFNEVNKEKGEFYIFVSVKNSI